MKNKIKYEFIFIIISLVIIIVVALATIKFTNNKITNNSNSTNSNTSTTSNLNEITINGDETDITLNDSLTITKEGVYKLSGEIKNGLITINTDGNVKLILNGVSITNNSGPCILVENAKNVIIELVSNTTNTLTDGTNYSVNDEDIDACIFSKDDLYISGEGTLTINANYKDGIVSKDDLFITSGIINITSNDDAIRGKDSVLIDGGNITINSKGDGIKTTNDTDEGKGNITVNNGTINITSVKDGFDAASTFTLNNGTITIKSDDDGIHANGYLEINNGTVTIDAAEGLEATYIKVNDGNITINASDDGINAANKSTKYQVTVEINGGNITIKMAQGDTDGIDSNGNIYINGGTINITGQSAFDYDGEAKYTGGTMIINGEETTTITNQFMNGQGGGMINNGQRQNYNSNPDGNRPQNDYRGRR